MTDDLTLELPRGGEEPSHQGDGAAPGDGEEDAAGEGEAGAQAGAEASRPKLIHLMFRRVPIAATELELREPNVGQSDQTDDDVVDEEFDDREFTVRLVHRQLVDGPAIEVVRAWPDHRLLAAAEAYLSFDLERDEPDEAAGSEADAQGAAASDEAEATSEAAAAARDPETPAPVVEPTEATDEVDQEPLTFSSFRDEMRAQAKRRAARYSGTILGIVNLAKENTEAIARLMKTNPAFSGELAKAIEPLANYKPFGGMDLAKLGGIANYKPFAGLDIAKLTERKINPFGGADIFKIAQEKLTPFGGMDLDKYKSITGLDALKGVDTEKLAGLTGTTKIGESLARMAADNQAAIEQFSRAIEMPKVRAIEPETTMRPVPLTRNIQNELLSDVGETLEKMHSDQLQTSGQQIEVLVEQTTVLKGQGELLTAMLATAKDQGGVISELLDTSKKQGTAIAGLLADAKGQKWSRRVMLWATVIAAIAAVVAALYAGDILRPFGVAGPAPTTSPIVNLSPVAPSPTLAPTPTPKVEPSPSVRPSASVRTTPPASASTAPQAA